MTTEERSHYSSYSAPSCHGEKLLEPDWRSILGQLAGRASHAASAVTKPSTVKDSTSRLNIGGSSLASLAASARRRLLADAKRYTSTYRDLPFAADSITPIIMGGHQPDLFHCGVWYKNFVLSDLGKATGAVPIHFIVDNDLCRATGIQIPAIVAGEVSQQWVDFDAAGPAMPWENRKLCNTDMWNSFPNRVLQKCAKVQGQPLLKQLWRHSSQLDRAAPLGQLLSQARHLVENDFGLQTLEVPLSHLVSSNEFATFGLHILKHLAAFQRCYNQQLDNYRIVHRIRNHAQPLPDLAAADHWLEAPFWCYSNQSSSRDALWVKMQSESLMLSDRRGWECSIDLTSDGAAIEQWVDLQTQGRCIRPRALITTMYARLLLCDLFVHGIGGGKYDQITDRISESFFNIVPAPYAVASATMHLRFDDLPAKFQMPAVDELPRAVQNLKTASANPEYLLHMQHLGMSPEERSQIQTLAAQKQKLLESIPDKGEKWEWHLAMKKVKQKLSELAQPQLRKLSAHVENLQNIELQQSKLHSREYSFCLFPAETIQECFGNPS